jgi:hypothetical protein
MRGTLAAKKKKQKKQKKNKEKLAARAGARVRFP